MKTSDLNNFYFAFDHFFPEGKPVNNEPFLKWNNRQEFIDEIKNITKRVKEIDISSGDPKLIKEAQLLLTELVETEKPIDSNIPQEGLREQQESDRATREAALKAAREEGIRKTNAFIESQLKRKRSIKVVPIQEIPVITLNSDDKKKLYDLGVSTKTDPGTAQKIFEEKINESLQKSPEEIKNAVPKGVVTKAAVDLVDKAKEFGDYKTAQEIPSKFAAMNPVSPVAALAILNDAKFKGIITDDQYRTIIAENAQNLALAIEAERNINATLTSPLLYGSPNVMSVLYGPDQITEFQAADNQETEDGVELDLSEVIDRGRDIRDIWERVSTGRTTVGEAAEATTTFVSSYSPSLDLAISSRASSLLVRALPAVSEITGFKTGVLAQQWLIQGAPQLMSPQIAGWITAGGPQQIVAPSMFTRTFALQSASGKYGIAIATGKNVYGANTLMTGIKVGGSKLAMAASATGTKIAASGVFARIGAFLGSIGPGLGTLIGAAVGWVVGKVAEKIPWDKVKKALPYIIGLIALPFLGPLAAIAAGLGTAALIGLGGGMLGTRVSLGAFGAGIGNFFWTLGKSTLITIGTPVLVILLVFPAVVALILFIINSGAYIVPPALRGELSGAVITSPYIDVIKTANPTGPFENSNLPLTVEYTVQIKAKRGNLTNIKINYNCNVIKKSSSTVCPSTDPDVPTSLSDLSEGSNSSQTISPSSPYIFKYKQTYNSLNYQDSFITDVITVTADAVEQSGAQAAGSASIKIGNPPEDCPSIWPTNHGYITQGAYTPTSCGNNCSHGVLEAIDIGVSHVLVMAGHSGTVVTAQTSSCLGNYVEIKSSCNGKNFISRYAHLEGVKVKNGQKVTMGQQIGLSGNTGACTTGAHLHYEFRYWPDGKPSYPKNPPYMMSPYIPHDVPRGCKDTAQCSVSF